MNIFEQWITGGAAEDRGASHFLEGFPLTDPAPGKDWGHHGGAAPAPSPTFRPHLQDTGVAALTLQISHAGLREGIDKPNVPQLVKGKPPPGERVQAGTWGT